MNISGFKSIISHFFDSLFVPTTPYLHEGKRSKGLDLLKLIAFLGMVLVHCSSDIIDLKNLPWEVPYILWYYLFPVTIPVFFTASGYALFGRENRPYTHFLKRILGILKVCFFSTLIIDLLFCLINHTRFSLIGNVTNFIVGIICDHWEHYGVNWFITTLIILYLLYPVLNNIYKRHPKLFLGIVAACFIIQTAFFIRSAGNATRYLFHESFIPQSFRLYIWIFYFCLGGIIKRYRICWRLGHLWIVFGLFAINLFVVHLYLVYYRGFFHFEYSYNGIVSILSVIAIFTYIMSRKIEWEWLKIVPQLFLPAFIISEITNYLLEIPFLSFPPILALSTIWIVSALSALFLAWLLTKTPVVNRLFKI